MNKWSELLIGLVLIAGAIFVAGIYPSWGQAAIAVLKGGIVWGVAAIGLLFLILGISDLKN